MKVMGSTATVMSWKEFERLDLDGPEETELLQGELIQMPPPKRRHMLVCDRLSRLLDAAFERRRVSNPDIKLGNVHMEMGYRLSDAPPSWLRPDVSISHPDQAGDDYYEGAPFMVFEVVSESDTAVRLERKVAEYLSHNAQEVWVIYPDRRHAWVYRPAAARLEEQAIHSDLLPGIEIPLAGVL
jgi:Uma2 family endonuclease